MLPKTSTPRRYDFLLVALLTLGLLGCGFREAHFQSAWKREVLSAHEAIQQYWRVEGRLPETLGEAWGSNRSEFSVVVQYEQQGNGAYLLWMLRADVAAYLEQPDGFEPTSVKPSQGDIWGEFHVDGRILGASWRSIWS